MGEDDCLGSEACICEIGRFGAGFANFELGFLEILFFIVLFSCTGSHFGSVGLPALYVQLDTLNGLLKMAF